MKYLCLVTKDYANSNANSPTTATTTTTMTAAAAAAPDTPVVGDESAPLPTSYLIAAPLPKACERDAANPGTAGAAALSQVNLPTISST